ncbi:hypothetical protein B0H16DRAFT_1449088 [Mycena metata]|uniref:Uncharacterized protein n=1 Tax=Mycena metata TaxID=1033252 RepID=A0AAD7K4Z4_9AGAR|nr:hypothetical protein B0H16DRAFT_1449088 [Mycena metata]
MPYHTTSEMLGGGSQPRRAQEWILHRGDDEAEGIFVKGLIEAPCGGHHCESPGPSAGRLLAKYEELETTKAYRAFVNASMTQTESVALGSSSTSLDGAAPQDANPGYTTKVPSRRKQMVLPPRRHLKRQVFAFGSYLAASCSRQLGLQLPTSQSPLW